jgi:hypothetical protein
MRINRVAWKCPAQRHTRNGFEDVRICKNTTKIKKTQHTITRKYHVVIKHRTEQNKNQGKKESNGKGR